MVTTSNATGRGRYVTIHIPDLPDGAVRAAAARLRAFEPLAFGVEVGAPAAILDAAADALTRPCATGPDGLTLDDEPLASVAAAIWDLPLDPTRRDPARVYQIMTGAELETLLRVVHVALTAPAAHLHQPCHGDQMPGPQCSHPCAAAPRCLTCGTPAPCPTLRTLGLVPVAQDVTGDVVQIRDVPATARGIAAELTLSGTRAGLARETACGLTPVDTDQTQEPA